MAETGEEAKEVPSKMETEDETEQGHSTVQQVSEAPASSSMAMDMEPEEKAALPSSSSGNGGGAQMEEDVTAKTNESADNDDDDEDEDDDDDEDEDEDDEAGHVQPITDAREISFKLADMNEYLTCKLCNGYFREAHTIMECLHTFCKVCLYNYLLTRDDRVGTQKKSDCPICHCNLMNAEPMKNHVRFDRTKQNIVDLLMPHFKKIDAENKAAATSSSAEGGADSKDGGREAGTHTRATSPPNGGGAAKSPSRASGGGQTDSRENDSNLTQKKAITPRIYLTFELRAISEKHTAAAAASSSSSSSSSGPSMKKLGKPWLRSSPKVTVKHLKKYLAMKLKLNHYEDIELTCQDEVLGNDHTLEFIKKTRWHETDKNLILYYRANGSSSRIV
eukprot:jgi/Bigna1/128658/aug1.7_g3366